MTSASKNFTLSQVANVLDITANGAVIGINAANYASNLGPVGNVTITGGSNGQVLSTDGNGTLSWSTVVTNNVANANYSAYAGNITIAAQSNITSLGTLSNLTSNGTVNFTNASNVSLGAVGNVKITGGSNAQVLTTNGSGGLSWATPAAGGNASYVTGQFILTSNGPPDTTWLKTGVTYSSNSYPALANVWAGYTANNTATSSTFGWGGQTAHIQYNGSRYIAIETGNGTVKRCKYSTDGVTWTNGGNLPTTAGGSWSPTIAWNGSVFFAVNYNTGSRIGATSPDGVTWTQRTLPAVPGNYSYYSVAALGSRLVAMEYTTIGNTCQTAVSDDNGATWTTGTVSMGGVTVSVDFVASNGTQLITAKYSGQETAYSSDGINWTRGGNLPGALFWEGATWNGSYWLMTNVSGNSTNLAKSFDGINWYNANFPTFLNCHRPLWNGKLWLIYIAGTTTLYAAADPATGWNQQNLGRSFAGHTIASDGTGNTFIGFDNLQDKMYTYNMVRASTFAVTNPGGISSQAEWYVKS